MKLLAVEEARARMLAGVAAPHGPEPVALDAALGRVLAGLALIAARDQPPFIASAMDGWAVRSMDAPGRLAIIGESAAGHGFAGVVGPGTRSGYSPAGPSPPGADCGGHAGRRHAGWRDPGRPAGARAASCAGRRPGFSGRREAARRRRPARSLVSLALVAAAGVAKVSVAPRPRVAILATGEEIVPPGTEPGPFQISSTRGPRLLAALAKTWARRSLGPRRAVGDDLDATRQAVGDGACDFVVTIGGASVGDHDLVKPALAGLGLERVGESVAMRPGKPTWVGHLADGRRVLGLGPGNPASAMVGAELFLRPLLMALQKAPTPAPAPLVAARLAERLAANGPREHWPRARLTHAADGALVAHVHSEQDSSLVGVFARAEALVRSPQRPRPRAGEARGYSAAGAVELTGRRW